MFHEVIRIVLLAWQAIVVDWHVLLGLKLIMIVDTIAIAGRDIVLHRMMNSSSDAEVHYF